MLEIFVRMYLYRWHKPTTPGGPVYSQISLEVRVVSFVVLSLTRRGSGPAYSQVSLGGWQAACIGLRSAPCRRQATVGCCLSLRE